MQHVALKTLVLTDRSDYGHCLDACLCISQFETIVGREPSSSRHCIECEDCFVQEHKLETLLFDVLELRPHAIEPVSEVGNLEADLSLCAGNEFEFDAVLLVEAPDSVSRDPHVGELSMEHFRSLLEREVCLRYQRLLAHKKGNVLALKLSALAFRDFDAHHVCTESKLE